MSADWRHITGEFSWNELQVKTNTWLSSSKVFVFWCKACVDLDLRCEKPVLFYVRTPKPPQVYIQHARNLPLMDTFKWDYSTFFNCRVGSCTGEQGTRLSIETRDCRWDRSACQGLCREAKKSLWITTIFLSNLLNETWEVRWVGACRRKWDFHTSELDKTGVLTPFVEQDFSINSTKWLLLFVYFLSLGRRNNFIKPKMESVNGGKKEMVIWTLAAGNQHLLKKYGAGRAFSHLSTLSHWGSWIHVLNYLTIQRK